MKRILLLLVLAGTLFAQAAGTSSISSGLNQLQDMSRTFLLVSMGVEAVVALLFVGGAALIYFKKLKGVEKKEALWLLAAVILGLIGVMFLLGFVLGLVSYFATPIVVKSMMG